MSYDPSWSINKSPGERFAGRNDDWLSKGSSSAKALLSNLLTKEVFDELFQGLQAEPQVRRSMMG